MELKKEKVIITRKAQESIRAIFDYTRTESSSLQTVKKVRDGIIAKCKSLKEFSDYSKEEYLAKLGDYKSVTIWNYLIIFSSTEDTIRILNVIHTSQHPDSRQDI